MKIEFIIPTYSRINHLKTIICSLLAQTSPNWIAHIVSDKSPHNEDIEIKAFLNHLKDDRIRYTRLEERYNDWGHTPRNYGLDNLICDNDDLVVMTGEDNYYVPKFVEVFLKKAQYMDKNFFFCSFLHNQAHLGQFYYPIKAKLEKGNIDIGCYAFRRFLSYEIRLDTKQLEADWQFVVDVINKFNYIIDVEYIDEILYVHN